MVGRHSFMFVHGLTLTPPICSYPVPKEVGKIGTESSTFIEPLAQRRDGIQAMFAKQVASSSPKKSQPLQNHVSKEEAEDDTTPGPSLRDPAHASTSSAEEQSSKRKHDPDNDGDDTMDEADVTPDPLLKRKSPAQKKQKVEVTHDDAVGVDNSDDNKVYLSYVCDGHLLINSSNALV